MDTARIFRRFGQVFCSENRQGTHGESGLLACARRKPPRGDLDNEVCVLNVLFALLTGAVDTLQRELLP